MQFPPIRESCAFFVKGKPEEFGADPRVFVLPPDNAGRLIDHAQAWLKAEEERNPALPLTLFSFPIHGRAYCVCSAPALYRAVFDPRRDYMPDGDGDPDNPLPEVWSEVHEHIRDDVPFRFAIDIDGKGVPRPSDDTILGAVDEAREILERTLFRVLKEQTPVTYVIYETRHRAKLSLHVVFRGFRLETAAAAKTLAGQLKAQWDCPLADLVDVQIYRRNGSLRVYQAKKIGQRARKEIMGVPNPTPTLFLHSLLTYPEPQRGVPTVANVALGGGPDFDGLTVMQYIGDAEQARVHDVVMAALATIFPLYGGLISRMRIIALHASKKVFAHTTVPRGILVQTDTGGCPVAKRVHRHAKVSFLILSNGIFQSLCWRGCGSCSVQFEKVKKLAAKKDPAAVDTERYLAMQRVLQLFFPSARVVDDLLSRHAMVLEANKKDYTIMTRQEIRGDHGESFFPHAAVALKQFYRNCFCYDSAEDKVVTHGDILMQKWLADQRRVEVPYGFVFRPLTTRDALHARLDSFDIHNGSLNTYMIPPVIAKGEANEQNGRWILENVFLALFDEGVERDALLNWIRFLFQMGRTRVGCFLHGAEGCGKTCVLNFFKMAYGAQCYATTSTEAFNEIYNAHLETAQLVVIDDLDHIKRNVLYSLIDADTMDVRKMYKARSTVGAPLHVTFLGAFNPGKNPLPMDEFMNRQRRFLAVTMKGDRTGDVDFWAEYARRLEDGGCLWLMEHFSREPFVFVRGEAVDTPTLAHLKVTGNDVVQAFVPYLERGVFHDVEGEVHEWGNAPLKVIGSKMTYINGIIQQLGISGYGPRREMRDARMILSKVIPFQRTHNMGSRRACTVAPHPHVVRNLVRLFNCAQTRSLLNPEELAFRPSSSADAL